MISHNHWFSAPWNKESPSLSAPHPQSSTSLVIIVMLCLLTETFLFPTTLARTTTPLKLNVLGGFPSSAGSGVELPVTPSVRARSMPATTRPSVNILGGFPLLAPGGTARATRAGECVQLVCCPSPVSSLMLSGSVDGASGGWQSSHAGAPHSFQRKRCWGGVGGSGKQHRADGSLLARNGIKSICAAAVPPVTCLVPQLTTR